MTDSSEVLAAPPRRLGRARWHLTPSSREAMWGFVFIGPWLIGLALLTAGPMIASLRPVADRLRPRPPGGGQVRRHRQLRPDGVRPERHEVTDRDLQVRAVRHPADDVRQPRLRAAPQQPAPDRPERPAHARLHAHPDPAGGEHARVDRLPQHRDRLDERDPPGSRSARSGLDQQRGVDLPGARADRAVGHRQLHAHQHRRPPVRPVGAVRGGADRRRGCLDDVPADHDPAAVADPALQPGHLPGRDVPVLHPGLHDDQRARRSRTTRRCSSTWSSSARRSPSTGWATARPSPGSCSSSCWS